MARGKNASLPNDPIGIGKSGLFGKRAENHENQNESPREKPHPVGQCKR
jgi:hypothetical protein